MRVAWKGPAKGDTRRATETVQQRALIIDARRCACVDAVERDVERLIERAPGSLAYDKHGAPSSRRTARDRHVRQFRRTVEREDKLIYSLAEPERPQLRQQVERDECPHLESGSGIERVEHAVVGADEDEGAPLAQALPEQCIVTSRIGFERRRREDGWRGCDDGTDWLGPDPIDERARIEPLG